MIYETTLTPRPPYDFEYILVRLELSSNRVLYNVQDRTVRRLLLIDNTPVLFEVNSLGSIDSPSLHVRLHHANTDQLREKAIQMICHMFSVDRALQSFYDAIRDKDSVLYDLTQQHPGLPLLLEPDAFEAMIGSIIGQQVNLTFAANLKHSLMELCSLTYEYEGHHFLAFPSSKEISELTYENLRAHKFSQRKAEYVIDFARAVYEGSFSLEKIQDLSNEEAISEMVGLRGIGRWTAECVLLFGLGRSDLLPAADIGLRNAIRLFYQLDHQPTEAEVREFAHPWKGWESYATCFLWTALGMASQKK